MPKDDRKKELDALLNTPPEDEEEETDEEETDEEENEDEETEETDEEDSEDDSDDSKKSDEDDQDEEEAEEDAEGEASKKDRWHGKSREEVIKAYEDLEKQKAPESKKEKKPAPKKGEDEEGEIKVPTDEELAKMTPKDFANWMIKSVRDMVSKTYESRSKVRDAVTTEIRDAQKEHPLLKTNAEYRELVLALIDTAAQKGVVMPLKEACEKVDAFSGKVKGDTKVSDEEKTRMKKAKAQVERGGKSPAAGDEPDKEKEKIEKIFGQGSNKTPLGGLGV